MRVLNIYPKDVYVQFEISIDQIEMVLDASEKIKIIYDSKEEPKITKAVEYFTNDFLKTLNEVVEDVKRKV